MEGGVQPTERASNQQSCIQKCVKVLWPFRHRIKGNPEDNLKNLKEAIKFHFKHCVDKAKEGPRIPLKAIFHVLLIGLVIPQVYFFAQDDAKLTRFVIGNEEAFREYFKQNNQCNQDIEKLYKLQDVYNQITLIVDSYYNISVQAVGSFVYGGDVDAINNTAPNLTMYIDYYDVGCDKAESYFFPYDNSTLTWHTDLFSQNVFNNTNRVNNNDASCCNIKATSSRCSREYCDCSVEEQIKCFINDTVSNLNRIDRIRFDFMLSTFLRASTVEKEAVYATFGIHITLLNDLYSSITVNIDVESHLRRSCGNFKKAITSLDIVIIVMLLLSFGMYLISVFNTITLALDMVKCLKSNFKDAKLIIPKKIWRCHIKYKDPSDRNTVKKFQILELCNKWYILMIFAHVILLVAVSVKISFDYKEEISIKRVESVRILLGVGVFLLLCGFLGMLTRFKGMNELFTTIQIAFPRVWRFAFCFVIFFAAFVLCGWLILGPYHPKFRDFSVSLESLYCIVNGDDLYTTFEGAHVNSQSYAVKFFSQLYLAAFIFTFIYVVLSLFIGIFTHAYEKLLEPEHEAFDCVRQWADPDFKPLYCNGASKSVYFQNNETPSEGTNNTPQVYDFSVQGNEPHEMKIRINDTYITLTSTCLSVKVEIAKLTPPDANSGNAELNLNKDNHDKRGSDDGENM